MSDLSGRRRQRADARRSIAAILDTAVRVLNENPEASVGEIANAAGLTRPTVYAHYPSREALLRAVLDRVTDEHVAAMDGADLDHGPPVAALERVLAVGWQTIRHHPLLLRTYLGRLDERAEQDRHQPIQDRLERLIKRGQNTGDFDRRHSPAWLAAVVIGLGHTAADQVSTGRMTPEAAEAALHRSTLQVFGVDLPATGATQDRAGLSGWSGTK